MQEAATFEGNAETSSTHPISILIAEDSESNQALFSLFLKGTSYGLTFAGNGREAVDAYIAAKYDLVFMDIIMPIMDGLEAMREIRTYEHTNDLPPTHIVAMSANTLSENNDDTTCAEHTHFMAKPIRKTTLLQCINRIVNK